MCIHLGVYYIHNLLLLYTIPLLDASFTDSAACPPLQLNAFHFTYLQFQLPEYDLHFFKHPLFPCKSFKPTAVLYFVSDLCYGR